MKNPLILLVLPVAIIFYGCNSVKTNKPVGVSIVRLLANPENYTGRRVSVIGYYHHELESSALYLSEDDARFRVRQNAIFLGSEAPSPTKIVATNDLFVLVEGTFSWGPSGKGHMNLYPGIINEITLVVPREASSKIVRKGPEN
jgi:hypothetical protein